MINITPVTNRIPYGGFESCDFALEAKSNIVIALSDKLQYELFERLKTLYSKKEIIERIGYFRNQRNISAYKLGIELGHSKTYFYRIESGEIQLTIDMLLEVLDVLQVSTAEFFCPTLNKDDKVLLDMISGLSQENKQTIIDLIKKLK